MEGDRRNVCRYVSNKRRRRRRTVRVRSQGHPPTQPAPASRSTTPPPHRNNNNTHRDLMARCQLTPTPLHILPPSLTSPPAPTPPTPTLPRTSRFLPQERGIRSSSPVCLSERVSERVAPPSYSVALLHVIILVLPPDRLLSFFFNLDFFLFFFYTRDVKGTNTIQNLYTRHI